MTHPKILAAIGQISQDKAVLARALEVAGAARAELHIIHVLDLPGDASKMDDVTSFLGQVALAERNRLEQAMKELNAAPSDATIHIKLGAHALTLIDFCNEMHPDLIVMRAHQREKISERLLGSTTDRVIAAAHVPVLVVKRAPKVPYSRIVLASDGADHAAQTCQFLINLLPEAKLKLVQAVQIPPQLKEAMLRIGTGREDLISHRNELLIKAQDHLREIAEHGGRRVKTKVIKGEPIKALSKLCRKSEVDLLALGQGRSSLISRAFIGSVSRRLLRDATCDVLIWCPPRTAL